MRWISKFDFFTLYRKKVTNGHFNPGSAITIRKIEMPDENTIVLGADKDMHDFTGVAQIPNAAVLFISKDKGQTYHEVTTGEEVFEDMYSATNFTMVQAYTLDKLAVKHHKILLLNNKTLDLKTILNFTDETTFFSGFDGEFVLVESSTDTKLINLFNNSETVLPTNKFGRNIFHVGNGKLIYKSNLEIRQYDVKKKHDSLLNSLKTKYDYFFLKNGKPALINKRQEQANGETLDVYDIYENKLYTETPENKKYYRYKNFVCDYTKIGPSPEIRYSYDYGKTWKVHHVREFSILQKIFGFYKDQFLVTEGIFFHGESPESGGRVMVGEFVK